jgi:hypothetical protein
MEKSIKKLDRLYIAVCVFIALDLVWIDATWLYFRGKL